MKARHRHGNGEYFMSDRSCCLGSRLFMYTHNLTIAPIRGCDGSSRTIQRALEWFAFHEQLVSLALVASHRVPYLKCMGLDASICRHWRRPGQTRPQMTTLLEICVLSEHPIISQRLIFTASFLFLSSSNPSWKRI